ncbi:ATP-binding protein [Salmonirosea aquatica]
MKNRTGAPVDGNDFFGREKEIAYVWDLLQNGNNILLPSPRRVGKSSFAKKMLEKAEGEGWEVIEINLERAHSELEFVELLTGELRKMSVWERSKESGIKLLEIISALKPTLSIGGAEVKLDWKKEKSNIYRELERILPHDREVLIFFDEVAVLLNGILLDSNGDKRQIEELMHWLRSLRQVSGSQIRWIFCSSVGIENFTTGHQLSKTINDFSYYELKPFSSEAATSMIIELEKGGNVTFNEEIRAQMLAKLGYLLPYFIQVLFEKMKGKIQIEDALIDQNLVNKAYNEIIEGAYLNTWDERLREQYGDHKDDAYLLLRHICRAKEGMKRENLHNLLYQKYSDADRTDSILATLLNMLQNDGYLAENNAHYLFRSPLIRDFWFNRFVK